jgi:hypothetical protein
MVRIRTQLHITVIGWVMKRYAIEAQGKSTYSIRLAIYDVAEERRECKACIPVEGIKTEG